MPIKQMHGLLRNLNFYFHLFMQSILYSLYIYIWSGSDYIQCKQNRKCINNANEAHRIWQWHDMKMKINI